MKEEIACFSLEKNHTMELALIDKSFVKNKQQHPQPDK